MRPDDGDARLQIARTDRHVPDGNAGNIGDRSTPACIEPADARRNRHF
jgi:hypothetical protein